MTMRTMRGVVALAGVAVLTAGLAACGGDEEGGSGGAGKTLSVLIGANTQYPKEFQAWQQSVSDKFKAQTGASVKFETLNRPSSREATCASPRGVISLKVAPRTPRRTSRAITSAGLLRP